MGTISLNTAVSAIYGMVCSFRKYIQDNINITDYDVGWSEKDSSWDLTSRWNFSTCDL